jgi:hypothetical protein
MWRVNGSYYPHPRHGSAPAIRRRITGARQMPRKKLGRTGKIRPSAWRGGSGSHVVRPKAEGRLRLAPVWTASRETREVPGVTCNCAGSRRLLTWIRRSRVRAALSNSRHLAHGDRVRGMLYFHFKRDKP